VKDLWKVPALVKMAGVPGGDAPPTLFGDGGEGTTVV